MSNLLHDKKFLIAITVVIFLAVSFFTYKTILSKQESDTEQKTTKVVKGDLKVEFSIDGKLSVDSYSPGFTLSGKINKVYVKEGDSVSKGQLLASLDAQEAQKNLEKELKNYTQERNNFDETTQVSYVDDPLTDTVRRILENNQWDLDKAVVDVELKDIVLRQSSLLSPIEGIVAQVNIKEGDYASTQSQPTQIIIVKPDSYSFVAYAEEDDVLKIAEDQHTEISLDAYTKQSFPAEITFISPLATIDANGLSSYKLTAAINQEELNGFKLLDGMEGSISFIAKKVDDVIYIPNKAVQKNEQDSYVHIIEENGKINKVSVETGFTDGKNVEIKDGLTPGQEVLIPN